MKMAVAFVQAPHDPSVWPVYVSNLGDGSVDVACPQATLSPREHVPTLTG